MWAIILCFLSTYSEVITAVSTALLMIITGVLSWLAFTQRRDIHRQLRAYVAVGEDEENKEIREGFKTKFQPIIANCGATPAYEVSFIGDIRALPAYIRHKSQLPPIVKKKLHP